MVRVVLVGVLAAIVSTGCGTVHLGTVRPGTPMVEYQVALAATGAVTIEPVYIGTVRMQAGTVQALASLAMTIATNYIAYQHKWDRCETLVTGAVTPMPFEPVSEASVGVVSPGTAYNVTGILKCDTRFGGAQVVESVSLTLRELRYPVDPAVPPPVPPIDVML